MSTRKVRGRGWAVLLAAGAAAWTASTSLAREVTVLASETGTNEVADVTVDPVRFFEQLVQRYQQLSVYEDSTTVIQVTERVGESPQRVETRIECAISGGELRVQTPASQLRKAIGLDLPFRQSDAEKKTQLQYFLWLAPHMKLRFSGEPLKDFRDSVDEGFTPTKAESVTVDDKELVQIKLKSGQSQSEDWTARFDLFVNPDSMLIERIEGEERRPDGSNFQTTMQITPIQAVAEDAPASLEVAPAPPISDGLVPEERPPAPAPPAPSSPPSGTPPAPPAGGVGGVG